ncbi:MULTISPECIES: hypothetical protein [unclassified Micromonospora]|uniref:hypothetical protein n=1 Tax=unclassified Micromonospora TaxID=2617518 RepID=UPI001C2164B7|nr:MULTISPECIES: hypothetical protein [unclassified Micromonospora]MBU8857670.1 hypothetical protein [Micromonospora sp. WMMB482]MDM4783296.1 hypothetical protein [Micromonospora sp. b486]
MGETRGVVKKSLGDWSRLNHSIGELGIILEYLIHGSTSSNLEVAIVGSYEISWKASDIGDLGDAKLEITITNRMSAASLTRPPVIGYVDGYDKYGRGVGAKMLDEALPTQKQTIVLHEQIPASNFRTGPPPPVICRNVISGNGGC